MACLSDFEEYHRGREYAKCEIKEHGTKAIDQLEACTFGSFDRTDFDRGILDVIRETSMPDGYYDGKTKTVHLKLKQQSNGCKMNIIKNAFAIMVIYTTMLIGTAHNLLVFPFRIIFNPNLANFKDDEFEELLFERGIGIAADCAKLYRIMMGKKNV